MFYTAPQRLTQVGLRPLTTERDIASSLRYRHDNCSQGNLGCGRGIPQVLEEMIEAVGTETDNDVVFLGYVFFAM